MRTAVRTYRVTLPGGIEREVPEGTPASDLAPEFTGAGMPVVACRFNNKISSLDRPVDRDATIDFIDLSSQDGSLIYRRSLTFILLRAVDELFPSLHVYINHSLKNAYYGEFYGDDLNGGKPVQFAPTDIARIKARMAEIVARDEPITRREVSIEEAKDIFEKARLKDKVELLAYRAEGPISVYTSGGVTNHFYGQLLPSTGHLKKFDLDLQPPGFVLVFPPHGKPNEIHEYHHEERIFAVIQEFESWSRILGVRTLAHLNKLVDTREINEYILVAEALHEKKLGHLADEIVAHTRQPRIILLSGLSSSGKTTTVKRLSIQLRVNGLKPLVIGLDDFFVERDRTPRDEYGELDFESFGAIDVDLLQDVVRRLIAGEEVALPKFDFVKGHPEPGHVVRLAKGQHLILEGIHALNPGLLPQVPDGLKFKIYISPLTHLNIDDHNRISTSDSRLIRRMVRDSRYRGYDGIATLSRWPSVRRGEQKNIFPYQNEADFIFNSSLPYEVLVLKHHAMQVLQQVPREHPVYSEAARLAKFLSYFRDIKPDIVPRHSLLREFIGGSSFKY